MLNPIMYLSLLRLYQAGRITEAGLDAAVARGDWINEAEKAEIMA